MPLLDIAISQPCSCFRNNILAFSSESRFHSKLVIDNDRRLASAFSWKTYCVTEKVDKIVNSGKIKVCRGGLIIKAIATLEITSLACKNEEVNQYKNLLRRDIDSVKSNSHVYEPQSSSEDFTVVDEREKLRRIRISKANKGNTPWNKGRKHSPETLRRIKERTRIAMQDPKVKMKLVNLGHAQSDETRMKIGVGVRLGWERRREKLMLQETCYYEWQNLIAVASRKGLLGEEELQWDSYKILNKQYEQEWFQSVEQRKTTPRSKGNKRAPKSAEQRKKIAAAIAAKWADPEYRNRVCSALAKFHGTAEVAERMPRRKPSGDGQTQKRRSKKKDETNDLAKHETKSQIQRIRLKKSRTPLYKDPFASSKLEMLKDIRAQRVAAINKQNEAISRAKLLIAEAEKAAIALEIAAKNSPLAQASLLESRMLISEAMHFIKSIENEDPVPFDMSETTTEPELHVDEEIDADNKYLDDANLRNVNGVQRLSSSDVEAQDFSFNTFVLPDLANGNASNYCHDDLLKTGGKPHETSSNNFLSQQSNDLVNLASFTKNLAYPKPAPNGTKNLSQTPQSSGLENSIPSEKAEPPQKQVKLTKKWVCGRLVEVPQET